MPRILVFGFLLVLSVFSHQALAAKVLKVLKNNRIVATVTKNEGALLKDADAVSCKFSSGEFTGQKVKFAKGRIVLLKFESDPKAEKGMKFSISAVEEDGDGDEQSVQEESDTSGSVADGSSLSARSTKSAGAGILYTPLSDWFFQYGITGFYNLSPNLHLGFSFITGSQDMTDDFKQDEVTTVRVTSIKAEGSAYWLWARYFVGNSFNLTGGLGYRQGAGTISIEEATTDIYLDVDITMSSIVAPIAIGNEWTWDNGYTIGVDWLVYYAALAGGSTVTTKTNSDLLSNELSDSRDEISDIFSGLAKSGSLTLALITMGFEF